MIILRATQVHVDFRRLAPENIALDRLYAAYITHYLDPVPAAAR